MKGEEEEEQDEEESHFNAERKPEENTWDSCPIPALSLLHYKSKMVYIFLKRKLELRISPDRVISSPVKRKKKLWGKDKKKRSSRINQIHERGIIGT